MSKVVSQEDLILRRRQWNEDGRKAALVAGCFDLLHPGHIRLLEQAHKHAEIVVVGVLDDACVSAPAVRRPGSVTRPITPVGERCEALAALAAVDYVFEFDTKSLPDLLGRLRPDFIVEGAEPSSPLSFAWAAATATGLIQLVRIPLEPGHSTSRLVERITQLHA